MLSRGSPKLSFSTAIDYSICLIGFYVLFEQAVFRFVKVHLDQAVFSLISTCLSPFAHLFLMLGMCVFFVQEWRFCAPTMTYEKHGERTSVPTPPSQCVDSIIVRGYDVALKFAWGNGSVLFAFVVCMRIPHLVLRPKRQYDSRMEFGGFSSSPGPAASLSSTFL